MGAFTIKTEEKIGPAAPGRAVLRDRMPSLDGWRALSITMVLLLHSTEKVGFPAGFSAGHFWIFFDGELGVRFFFVISGFLITYLLLKEQERTGRVDLRSFYARRALRILPVYCAYLVVMAVLQMTTALHQTLVAWIGVLTFTINFLPRSQICGHLWSLAVEEQFYLLWPVTFIWLNRKNSRARYLFVFAAPIVVAWVCHVIALAKLSPWIIHPLFHHQSSLVNFDSLDIGCTAAFVLAKAEKRIAELLNGAMKFAGIGLGVVLILLPRWFSDQPPLSYVFGTIGNTCQAVGFAMLLVISVIHPGPFKPLNFRVVAQFGVLSYSIYIWQQIFSCNPVTYGVSNVWWLTFPGWIPPALLVAAISYYGLERPLLRFRARFRKV